MADILISVALATVALMSTGLGVLMALKPPVSKFARYTYVAAFLALGATGIVLTFLQSARAQDAQTRSQQEQSRLLGKVDALSTLVGPATREDSRRIAESLAKILEADPADQQTSSRSTPAVPSLKRRALTVAAEILTCLAERGSTTPTVLEGSPDADKQRDAQERYIEETGSLCVKKLGIRIFEVRNDFKERGLTDAELV